MKKYNWQPTDAQFLEALLFASGSDGSAPLLEVLLMADAADGTVFEAKEVEEAVLKLVAAGVVTIKKNQLTISPAFLQQYEEQTIQEGLTENNELLLNLLQEQPISEETIKAAKEDTLKKYKLKNQYQAYKEQFGG